MTLNPSNDNPKKRRRRHHAHAEHPDSEHSASSDEEVKMKPTPRYPVDRELKLDALSLVFKGTHSKFVDLAEREVEHEEVPKEPLYCVCRTDVEQHFSHYTRPFMSKMKENGEWDTVFGSGVISDSDSKHIERENGKFIE
jgi:hypothetical protein